MTEDHRHAAWERLKAVALALANCDAEVAGDAEHERLRQELQRVTAEWVQAEEERQ